MDMEHPHLMRILSWSAEPGRWVCCELFDANLFAYMRNVRPWSAQAHLFTQILVPIVSAVGFLHSKNYVHKDISPHHVMFLNDLSRVVLSGHKLSKTFKSQTTFLSSAKRGEIHWMDPNCYSSNTCYAFESDVYSLGAILGELLTGDLPYNGDSHGRGGRGWRSLGGVTRRAAVHGVEL
jgi:serine/threonine-protein kinase